MMTPSQIVTILVRLAATQRNLPLRMTEEEHTALRAAARWIPRNPALAAQLECDAEKGVGILVGYTMRAAARALRS
jgi:antitoxin component of RelBE/YafQ-DinJ toxin-antitoxin module